MAGLPLIAQRWRLAALGTIVVCASGVVALGMRFHATSSPDPIDSLVGPALFVGSPTARDALWAVVVLGDPVVVAACAAVLAVAAARAGHWAAALVALAGPAASAALTEFVLKPSVGRTKSDDLAFPSGHTVTTTSLSVVVLILTGSMHRPRSVRARSMVRAVAGLAPISVGAALVALDLHYATDVIGGWFTAVAVVVAVALALDAEPVRRFSGGAAAPTGGTGWRRNRGRGAHPPSC